MFTAESDSDDGHIRESQAKLQFRKIMHCKQKSQHKKHVPFPPISRDD